jgi:outer membrane protein assembly factor BamB
MRRAALVALGAGVLTVASPVLMAPEATSSNLSVGAPSCATPDDWTMYQHGPDHHARPGCSGINPLDVATLRPSWLFQTPQPVTASPTVVNGQVYVGDDGGTFYDIDAATGKVPSRWTNFSVTNFTCPGDTKTSDTHTPSYGEITSSAAVGSIPGYKNPVVFFGGGGTLFALDATNGNCLWATDLDPNNTSSSMEVESSPVLFQHGNNGATEVIVGSDSNESAGSSAPPGIQALNAKDGSLIWKYEPENDSTVTSLEETPGLPTATTNGCGDVWSSPALDAGALQSDGLVVGTTGNCPQGSQSPASIDEANTRAGCPTPGNAPALEGIVALDATTGCRQWRWSEPANAYTGTNFPDGGDTDIGSSPMLGTIETTSTTGAVVTHSAVLDGSKSGFMYALDETTTDPQHRLLWSSQPAQPGETGPAFAGAIGGFIGSSAFDTVDLGPLGGTRPAVFGSTALLTPFDGNGIPSPDTTLICVDISSGTPAPAQHCDPLRIASLHAVNADTGAVIWQAPVALPSYAATTTTNGVVFAPSTTGFSIDAYDAATGVPLWSFPTGGAMSSGAAIVGPSVFVGAGTAEQVTNGAPTTPPAQVNGVWCFSVAG